jgi:hypothetical protein
VELLFKHVDRRDLIERAIDDATGRRGWAHVEVRFADGRCFSSQYPAGVRFLPGIDTSDPAVWAVVPVPWIETPEVLAWCESQVGMGYDYAAAVFSALHIDYRSADRWFCSEIVIEVGSRCRNGLLGCPEMLNPADLYDFIVGKTAARPYDAMPLQEVR